jgi:hypothetical protein
MGRRETTTSGRNHSEEVFWGQIGDVGSKIDNERAKRFQIKRHPCNLPWRLDVQRRRMQRSVPVRSQLNNRQEGVIVDVDDIDDAETVHSP